MSDSAPPIGPTTILVTARHRIFNDDLPFRNWQPYGVHHARRVAERATACGMPVHGWVLFWEMPFDASHAHACRGCAEAVGGRRRHADEPAWPLLQKRRTNQQS